MSPVPAGVMVSKVCHQYRVKERLRAVGGERKTRGKNSQQEEQSYRGEWQSLGSGVQPRLRCEMQSILSLGWVSNNRNNIKIMSGMLATYARF